MFRLSVESLHLQSFLTLFKDEQTKNARRHNSSPTYDRREGRKDEQTKNAVCHNSSPTYDRRKGRKDEQTKNALCHNSSPTYSRREGRKEEQTTLVVTTLAPQMRGHRGFLLEVPSHAGKFSPRAANPT